MTGFSSSAKLCIECSEDISHRSPKALYCKPCYQTHERELNRARANKAYAEQREEKIAQVRAYAQTPGGQAKRIEWRQNNPGRLRTYRDRERQAYREKAGYDPEGRTCVDCDADISHRGGRAKYCESCSEKRYGKQGRTCLVCGQDISHRGPRAIYCNSTCAIQLSSFNEASGYERQCTKCGVMKPYLEFRLKYGRRINPCKACEAAAARVTGKNLTPEQRIAKNQKKRIYAANRTPEQKKNDKVSQRNSLMKKRYGPEFDERALYDSQNGLCAICGVPKPFKGDEGESGDCLELDHDHGTKKPRGFLCKKCNLKLLPSYEKFPLEYQDSPRINAYLLKGKL